MKSISVKSHKGRYSIVVGQGLLAKTGRLMKKANLLISADSGPLHMANSLGTNIIGIFGPTRPEITGPRGQGQSKILQHDVGCNREACYYLNCPHNICMQAVRVDEIAASTLLS